MLCHQRRGDVVLCRKGVARTEMNFCPAAACKAIARFAVSAVTWRQAPIRSAASGCSRAKRSWIWHSTGISRAAHCTRRCPASASCASAIAGRGLRFLAVAHPLSLSAKLSSAPCPRPCSLAMNRRIPPPTLPALRHAAASTISPTAWKPSASYAFTAGVFVGSIERTMSSQCCNSAATTALVVSVASPRPRYCGWVENVANHGDPVGWADRVRAGRRHEPSRIRRRRSSNRCRCAGRDKKSAPLHCHRVGSRRGPDCRAAGPLGFPWR